MPSSFCNHRRQAMPTITRSRISAATEAPICFVTFSSPHHLARGASLALTERLRSQPKSVRARLCTRNRTERRQRHSLRSGRAASGSGARERVTAAHLHPGNRGQLHLPGFGRPGCRRVHGEHCSAECVLELDEPERRGDGHALVGTSCDVERRRTELLCGYRRNLDACRHARRSSRAPNASGAPAAASASFACTVPTGAGQFTVPSYVP
jgi:hypothetical protein